MKLRHVLSSASALAIALVASPSRAQDADRASPARNASADYSVVFKDDPMQASGLAPLGDRLVLGMHGIRGTLIRPRTQFVPELLKTVENL